MARFDRNMVATTEDWNALPDLYKAAQWFYRDIQVPGREDIKFKSVPILVEIKHKGVTKLVTVRGILGSLTRKKGCEVTGVVFHNFIRVDAELLEDDNGTIAIRAAGVIVIKQGGYDEFIPSNMEWDDAANGYAFDHALHTNCYYEADPFEGRG